MYEIEILHIVKNPNQVTNENNPTRSWIQQGFFSQLGEMLL